MWGSDEGKRRPQSWLDVARNWVSQGTEEEEQRMESGSSWAGGTYKVYHREPGHLDSDVGFNPFALVTTSYYLLKPH